jgi:NADH dehydrogenase
MGDLATIGRRAAIVSFHGLKLKGFIAWLFWGVAHIYFLIGLKNRFIVAFTWFWDFITFNRGARLITDFGEGAAPSPPVPERPPAA